MNIALVVKDENILKAMQSDLDKEAVDLIKEYLQCDNSFLILFNTDTREVKVIKRKMGELDGPGL